MAGVFYPGTKEAVEKEISSYATAEKNRQPALGLISPHAGYRYSGPVAAKVFSKVLITGSVILIGPNHRGAGSSFPPPKAAICAEGEWTTPTGPAPIDETLSALLLEESPLLTIDPMAHDGEHSLEVQIPFIHFYSGAVKIVPIILSRISPDQAMFLAEGIIRSVKRFGKPVTLVASTDMSHYVPHKVAEIEDRKAIEKILALDGPGLMETCGRESISMCGDGPTAVVIEACKGLGATTAELIDYKTSGQTGGDYSSVVGYAGLVIR